MDTRCRRPSASVRGRAWTRRRSTATPTTRLEHRLRTLATCHFRGHRPRLVRATGTTTLRLVVLPLTTHGCDDPARANHVRPPRHAARASRQGAPDEPSTAQRTSDSSSHVQRRRGCGDTWDLAHYRLSVREDEGASVAALPRAHRHPGRCDRCAPRRPGKLAAVTLCV
jgi:hypothetical protein